MIFVCNTYCQFIFCYTFVYSIFSNILDQLWKICYYYYRDCIFSHYTYSFNETKNPFMLKSEGKYHLKQVTHMKQRIRFRQFCTRFFRDHTLLHIHNCKKETVIITSIQIAVPKQECIFLQVQFHLSVTTGNELGQLFIERPTPFFFPFGPLLT